LHCSAQQLAYGKTNPRAGCIRALQIKSNHVAANPLFALTVNGLKISMLQQPRTPGEPLRGFCALLGHGERRLLVPVTWFYRNSLPSLGPAAGKDRLAAFRFHTGPESVGFGPAAAVRLKRALRHATKVLLLKIFARGKREV
jgi:hypothetical protein